MLRDTRSSPEARTRLMGHPAIENRTPFAFEALFLADEEFRPLVVPVIKGTFDIAPGRCVLAEKQVPIHLSGECWGADPETSSYKYEPEVAFFKPATDVVLVGHAHAPRSGTTVMDVRLAVGTLHKSLRVFGERMWLQAAGATATRPAPFETMPLTYERAFGGWDRRDPDPMRHACEARNPIGTGFARVLPDEGLPLPNVEDPAALVGRFGDRPAPAGFGFVSPHWQPRAALAGTYDAKWQAERGPLLARDFDRRHLNAASTGLVAAGYLLGNERVVAEGVSREGTLSFGLPAVPAPMVTIVRKGAPDLDLTTVLDTVILEPDEGRVQLLWRAFAPLRTGPHDVRAISISSARVAAVA